MKCPRCQHENPTGTKFCGQCAAPLASTCPSCGAANPPENKFCGQCAAPFRIPTTTKFAAPDSYTPKHLAEKILTSKAALEGERKQVTVLFADLKGSMELLADRDPEEARRILDPVLEQMMEAVHRYEGTVNQVMGDGIMALFGAPVAHEDHAVRACYAALRMQESLRKYADDVRRKEGVTIGIRVGLNSGEVVVRAIGSDLRMDYTAVGQTTHLAARMEQLSEPSKTLLTPATLALAREFVQARSLGAMRVKGLSETIEVYELLGVNAVRSRFQAHATRGLTKFVGRTSEMAQLAEALDLARNGRGQIVAVVGEPGVGKSRLFWEFAHSHHVEGCLVIEAASLSYGKGTTYGPVIELLRKYFQIEPRDEVRTLVEKVTGKLVSLDRAMEPALPAFLALLDVPVADEEWSRLDPPQRRQRTLDAVKRLLLRESRMQPLVVVFEDLHWVDDETQATLEALADSLPTARILLLVSYRPEYRHAWGSKTYYRQLRIDALSVANADELLEALLGVDSSLEGLKRLLISRTEGNPFFLEEIVRTLVETKMLAGDGGEYSLTRTPDSLQIPATAQAILAARIDRLGPEDKRLLQAASVIGKDVPVALLELVADISEEGLQRSLTRLRAAEFLYETKLFPDAEYTFKHALTHEVTYGGLLHERRRTLHAQIVTAIEALHPDRVAEHVETLAHHARRGQVYDKAVRYLRQAGLRAVARSALAEGRKSFDEALAILEQLPWDGTILEQTFDVRLELRPVLVQLGELEPMRRCLHEAKEIAERLSDRTRLCRVSVFMSHAHALMGEVEQAAKTAEDALETAKELDDLSLSILSRTFVEQAQNLLGNYEVAARVALENIALLPADLIYERFGNLVPPSVWDRFWASISLVSLGRFAESMEHATAAIRIAEPTHQPFTIFLANFGVAINRLFKGDWALARLAIDRCIAVSREGAGPSALVLCMPAHALVLAQLGQDTESDNQILQGQQIVVRFAAVGLVGYLALTYNLLGRACLVRSQLEAARNFGTRVCEFFPTQQGLVAEACLLLGDIATHPDRFDAERGEAHYRQALALAEPRSMRPLVAHCHLGLGKLYRSTGKHEQAREHLITATTMYREMDMTSWLERAEAEVTGST